MLVLIIVIVVLAVALAGSMIGVGIAAIRSNKREQAAVVATPAPEAPKPNEDLYEVGCVSLIWNPQSETPTGDAYSILALYDGKIDGLAPKAAAFETKQA